MRPILQPAKSPGDELAAMLTPSRFDRMLAAIAPAWGVARLRNRRAFAYEAARNTRLRASAVVLGGPEDYQAFPDRLQLIRQVRDLEQNFGLFQSIIDKLAMYAFGRLRYQAHTADKATNDIYEEYLAEECFPACDITGRNNFRTMVCLAFKSQIRDGDYALKWQRTASGLKLVGIESDRIGGNVMVSGDMFNMQGILIAPDSGTPNAYRVYQRTKADAYVNPVDVPASEILHYFDPRRVDQYRGITPFAPVINEARDWKEMMEACRIGTKFENYHAAIGYTPSGQPVNSPSSYIDGADTINGTTPITEQEIKPGLVQWAPTGTKVDFIKSDRPSGQFQNYTENLIRLMGSALNLPMGFLYNLSGLTGPAARMDSQQAQRVIEWHQQNMKERVLDRAKNMFLMEGIATGRIPYSPKWYCGGWQFPPWLSIDVGRDSAAGINEWRAGLKSKEEWYAESGADAEEQEAKIVQETDRTIAKAKELAKQHEIPFEVAYNILETRTPNGLFTNGIPSANDGEEKPDLPPATDSNGRPLGNFDGADNVVDTLNGAQITAVLEVLDKLRADDLPSAGAVQLLVGVGLSSEAANGIVSGVAALPAKEAPPTESAKPDAATAADFASGFLHRNSVKELSASITNRINRLTLPDDEWLN